VRRDAAVTDKGKAAFSWPEFADGPYAAVPRSRLPLAPVILQSRRSCCAPDEQWQADCTLARRWQCDSRYESQHLGLRTFVLAARCSRGLTTGGKIVSTSAHAWRTRPRADSCDDVCARGHTWAGLERRLAGRNKALVAQSQEMKPKLCAPSDYLLMRNYLWLPRRMCRGSGARGRLFLRSGLCRRSSNTSARV
jgi:hypothetical protein